MGILEDLEKLLKIERFRKLFDEAERLDEKYGGNIEQEVADARARGETVDFPWRQKKD